MSAMMRLSRLAMRQAMHEAGGLGALGVLAPGSAPIKRAMATEAAPAATPVAPPPPPPQSSGGFFKWAMGGAVAGGAFLAYSLYGGGPAPLAPGPVITQQAAAQEAPSKPGDYDAVRKAVANILEAEYEDGSYGPVLVRLAWHASGTYDAKSGTGGSNGSTMRYSPESNHGANAGLAVARKLLDPIKARFPWISYADLWTLAGAVAIEEMGGPHIPWRAGRADKTADDCTPDGRLPDAAQGAAHIRAVFNRMGFNDQEIVALSGAHTIGRCHTDRSGFSGPWTNAPTTFSNMYFTELINNKWTKKKWDGPLQYEDTSKTLMMLPTDMVILWDKKFKKFTDLYAKDDAKFFEDFAAAFSKLMELGVPFPAGASPAA